MRLQDFLKETNQSAADLAKSSGVNKATLSFFLSGKRGLALETAAKIVKATGGLVGFDDLVPPNNGPAKNHRP